MTAKLHTGAAIEFCAATAVRAGEDWNLPTVVLVHGWESRMFSSTTYREIAQRLNALGYNALLLSLRGHEDAAGNISTVTRYDHVQDIHAAFQNLAERPEVDRSRCAAIGSSYGAYLLACMASQLVPVKLLVLRAPALYPDEGWNAPTQLLVNRPDRLEWRRTVRTVAESKALMGIAGYKGKLSVVWSDQDEDMPMGVLDSYCRAIGSDEPVHTIHGASHSLSGKYREEYLDLLKTFFADNYPSR